MSKPKVHVEGADIGDPYSLYGLQKNINTTISQTNALRKEKYVWAEQCVLGPIDNVDSYSKSATDERIAKATSRYKKRKTWSIGTTIEGPLTDSALNKEITATQKAMKARVAKYHKKHKSVQRDATGAAIGHYKKVSLHKASSAVAKPFGEVSKKHAEDVKHLRYNLNISYGDSGSNVTNYFDRLYSVYPQIEQDSFCQYVFFVRPSCNIYQGGATKTLQKLTAAQLKSGMYGRSCPANDQFFRYMKTRYNNVLGQLAAEFSNSHDFMPFLVGRTESLQVPDYSIKSSTLNQPYTNLSLPYGIHTFESQTGGDFDVSFRDDSEYRIHKMFQAWLKYINYVTKNEFVPEMKFIQYNKFDYCTSVYNIVCKADGKTIVAWTKYTGAFPTSVSTSDYSFSRGNGSTDAKFSVPFKYFFSEVMEPEILVDFNENSHIDNKNIAKNKKWVSEHDAPIYDTTKLTDYGFDFSAAKKKGRKFMNGHAVQGTGNGLVGAPFIYKNHDNIYCLGWKKIDTDSMW